jgi:trimeric autotransporter adhesin
LYWKLDETSGTTVLDSSGNNFNGVYGGDVGTPAPSPNVPALMFANPRSRLFTLDNRHFARVVGMPARLKPANNFTVSVWYRSTSLGGSVTEIVGGGSNYGLRLRATEVEFFKSTGGGGIYLRGTGPNHLDGNWHHLAGVQSRSGMKLYFDGVLRGSHTDSLDVVYDVGNDFNVGRHNNFISWDFGGNVDEVRLYERVLSSDEVAALAQGRY